MDPVDVIAAIIRLRRQDPGYGAARIAEDILKDLELRGFKIVWSNTKD